MTKFRSVDLTNIIEKAKNSKKKTVFKKFIGGGFEVRNATTFPDKYGSVIHIGHDNFYGDVFIAYSSNPNDFTIFFGEAGDEFKDNGE